MSESELVMLLYGDVNVNVNINECIFASTFHH